MIQRIFCAIDKHRWEYQFPLRRHPGMGDKRWCSECRQVELAYLVWKGTYWSFDKWAREEDWYKLSYK